MIENIENKSRKQKVYGSRVCLWTHTVVYQETGREVFVGPKLHRIYTKIKIGD